MYQLVCQEKEHCILSEDYTLNLDGSYFRIILNQMLWDLSEIFKFIWCVCLYLCHDVCMCWGVGEELEELICVSWNQIQGLAAGSNLDGWNCAFYFKLSFMHMYVYVPCVCRHLRRPEEGVRFSKTGFTRVWESLLNLSAGNGSKCS